MAGICLWNGFGHSGTLTKKLFLEHSGMGWDGIWLWSIQGISDKNFVRHVFQGIQGFVSGIGFVSGAFRAEFSTPYTYLIRNMLLYKKSRP